jgi:hypothetical protein
MWDFFRDGGMPMYATAFFGLFLLAAAVRTALDPGRRLATLTLALGLVTLCSGALGTVTGVIATFRYLHQVPEADLAKIAALGTAESLHNTVLALLLCLVAALLASVGAFRAARTLPAPAVA